MIDYITKWHKELEIFCKVKPIIIIEGNVLDVYQYPIEGSITKGSIVRLPEYLHYFFSDFGYKAIAFYDGKKFYNSCDENHMETFANMIGGNLDGNKYIQSNFKSNNASSATSIIRGVLNQTITPSVIVMNLVSRYIISPDNINQNDVDSFTNLCLSSLEGKDVKTETGMLKNLVVMIVNKVNDIPPWFYLDNPNVKIINICTPSREEREALVKGDNFSSFFVKEIFNEDIKYYEQNQDELKKVQDKFVGLTDGFSFTEINGMRKLCKNERMHISEMSKVVDLYRYGLKENPWDSLDIEEIKNAKEDFQKRVKGQDLAIIKTLDVIKRAVTGMSGLQGSSHNKPKGILFFAGPTGTGKTETAKTLAQKLFGDESCCIRFDMSEYSQSHSDQKLLGAPPGYVGYEAGGQLTNAVKNNPFSILLFDEIEKAHPSIFDKFLQILEDGRMTDGQGNTVYFSECIIVFTSNLGIYTSNTEGVRTPNVTSQMEYDEVQKKVRHAIEDYFKLELGRPEILNRIGENIVVFDFIRPQTAELILRSQIDKIKFNLETEKHISLQISDCAFEKLKENSLNNLSNGGRGIGNIVESMLINPLSRYIFDEGIKNNVKLIINDIYYEDFSYTLLCSCEMNS